MLDRIEQYADMHLSRQPWIGLIVALLGGVLVAFLPITAVVLSVVLFVLFVVAMLTLKQPLWALALTLVLAPLGAWEAQHPILSALPLPLGQLAWVGTCVVWAFHWLAQRKRSVPVFGVQRPLVFFIFVTLLSLLTTESMSLGAKEVIKWLEILLIVWLVLDTRPFKDQRSVLVLLGILFFPVLIQSVLGISQFVQVDGPESFLILDRFYRAYGTFQQPNPFGGFMAMNGLLAIGIAAGLGLDWFWDKFVDDGREINTSWFDIAILLTSAVFAALACIALIASWSRGAWLGFAVGGAALALFWPRKRVWGLSLIIGGLFLLVVAWQAGALPDSIVARIASSTDFEVNNLRDIQLTDGNYALLERFAFWQAAFEMAEQNLWLGVGFGAYDAAYGEFAPVTWPQSLGHAHNYYLNLIAEIGILGLGAYVVFWSAVVWQNLMLLQRTNGLNRAVLLGLLGCWVALSAHQLVDKLYVNNMYLHIGVLLALQQVISQIDVQRQPIYVENEEL